MFKVGDKVTFLEDPRKGLTGIVTDTTWAGISQFQGFSTLYQRVNVEMDKNSKHVHQMESASRFWANA